MAERRPGEPWVNYGRRALKETQDELVLIRTDMPGWEARYGHYPGDAYTRTMEAQETRLKKDIAQAKRAQ